MTDSIIEDIQRLAAKLQGARDVNEIFEFAKENADALAHHSETMPAFFTIMAHAPANQADIAMDWCANRIHRVYDPKEKRLIGRAALRILSRVPPLTPALFNAACNVAWGDFYSSPGILRIALRHAKDMPNPSEAAGLVASRAHGGIKQTKELNYSSGNSGIYPGVGSGGHSGRLHKGPVVAVKRWQLRSIAGRAERLERRLNKEETIRQEQDHAVNYGNPRRSAERQLKRTVKRRFGGPV
jgi:hypothetical protein